MKAYNYRNTSYSLSHLPENLHLIIQTDLYLFYVSADNNKELWKYTIALGTDALIETRANKNIARIYPTDDFLYLVDCEYDDTTSYIWSLRIVDDDIVEIESIPADVFDIWRFGGETYVSYFGSAGFTLEAENITPDGDVVTEWTTTGGNHFGEVIDDNEATYIYDDVENHNDKFDFTTLALDPEFDSGEIYEIEIKVKGKCGLTLIAIIEVTGNKGGTVAGKPLIFNIGEGIVWKNAIWSGLSLVEADLDGIQFNFNTDDLVEDIYIYEIYAVVRFYGDNQIHLNIKNLDTEVIQSNNMGAIGARTWEMSQIAVVGNDFYFLCKWSDENVFVWRFQTGDDSFDEMEDCGANTSMASVIQWAISYNEANVLYFVLDYNGTDYLYTYNFDTDLLTRVAPYDVALMLNRNTNILSDAPFNLEKGFDINENRIFQITRRRGNVNEFSRLTNEPGSVVAVTDNFLIIDGSAEVWELVDISEYVSFFKAYHPKEGYPKAEMIVRKTEVNIFKNMFIQVFDQYSGDGVSGEEIVFEGLVKDYDDHLKQWVLLISQASEMDNIEPEGEYIGRTDENIRAVHVLETDYITDGIIDAGHNLGTIDYVGNKSYYDILHAYKDQDYYTFYTNPIGNLYYGSGTIYCGADLMRGTGAWNDNIINLQTSRPSLEINQVTVKGALGFEGFDEDLAAQAVVGVIPIVVRDATLNSNALCDDKATNILHREGSAVHYIEFDYSKPSVGFLQPGQYINFAYYSADINVGSGQYIIDKLDYDGLGGLNHVRASNGLLFTKSDRGIYIPEENSQLIEELNQKVENIAGGYALYLHAEASTDIGGYRILEADDPDAIKTDICGVAIVGNNQLIEEFATEPGLPALLILLRGVYNFHVHTEKTAGTKDATLYYEIYKRAAAGAETLLGTSDESPIIPEVEDHFDMHMLLESETLLLDDRIVLKVYANQEGFGTNPTISVYIEGDTTARLQVPASLGDLVAAGAGEINTGANVGADGLGVFKQKAGVQLQFKHIAPASAKITVVANGDDIDLDVAEGEISHDSIADVSANDHINNLTDITTRNHNDLQNIDAGDINHLTDVQVAALHATYTNAEAVAAVEAAGIDFDATKTLGFVDDAGGVFIDRIYDENDMASDDEHGLATQQSIKAAIAAGGGGAPAKHYYVATAAEFNTAIAAIEAANESAIIYVTADLTNVQATINDANVDIIINGLGHTLEADGENRILTVTICDTFLIRNCKFDATDFGNATSRPVLDIQAGRCYVYDCEFIVDGSDSGIGIHVDDDADFSLIQGCYFTGGWRHAIRLNAPEHCSVINNFIVGVNQGMVIYSGYNYIAGNHIYAPGATGVGINIPGGDRNVIMGNIIYDCVLAGIYIQSNADQNNIIGNNCYSCTTYGIRVHTADCNDTIIDGNVCKSNGTNISDAGTGTTIGDNES